MELLSIGGEGGPIEINGGLGVNFVVRNNNDYSLTNVLWSIDVEGGIILRDESDSGVIDVLAVGESTKY